MPCFTSSNTDSADKYRPAIGLEEECTTYLQTIIHYLLHTSQTVNWCAINSHLPKQERLLNMAYRSMYP